MTSGGKILQAIPVNTINLYEYALERARASAQRRELPTVARESGLDYSWLSKFARGAIPGASYAMVDKLAQFYMGRERAAEATPREAAA